MQAQQCKMARAALKLGGRELAGLAKVSPDTVARFERGEDLKDRTIEAIAPPLKKPASNLSTKTAAAPACGSKSQRQKAKRNKVRLNGV